MGIKTVAVYSEADADALHVREADEAVLIGPPPATQSYLLIDRIVEACKQTGAAGGPSRLRLPVGEAGVREGAGRGRHRLHRSRRRMRSPPWATRSSRRSWRRRPASAPCRAISASITDADEAVKIANDIGYPVMIKASAGGGGKGMRIA